MHALGILATELRLGHSWKPQDLEGFYYRYQAVWSVSPTPAGHQSDLNFIMQMVEDLATQ